MTLRRRRRPGMFRAVCGGGLASVLVLACAQDWAVREVEDAGVGPIEAGADAPVDRDARADAPAPADSGADVDARAVDCDAVRADVEAKRKEARRCVLSSGHCTTTVKNQCDCDVVIAVAGSASVAAYQQAVVTWKNSGCQLGCGTCAATTPRNCLQNGADILCVP